MREDLDGNGTYTATTEAEMREHNFANEIVERDPIPTGSGPTLPFAYDDAGNLQSADRPSGTSTDLYVHDAWNRLVGHAVDGESVVENADYEYNALHWRTVKRRLAQSGITPQERRLYYSAAWQLIQEDIDNNHASHPGIDWVGQQVWGLRYIDDAVFRRSYNPDLGAEELEAHHDHITDAQVSTIAMIGTGSNPILFERVRYRPYGEAAHRFPGDFNDDGYCDSADQTLLTGALTAASFTTAFVIGKRQALQPLGAVRDGIGLTCAKCVYNLSATPEGWPCPECGSSPRFERGARRRRTVN